MESRFTGISVRFAESLSDINHVANLRKCAYGRYEWAERSGITTTDALDHQPWVDSLLAIRGDEPAGTMRLVRADRNSLDRISSYLTWREEIDDLVKGSEASIMEFNRFAVASREAVPTVSAALFRTALMAQITENVSLTVGEIRRRHLSFYRRVLGMTASRDGRMDGILPGEFHLVYGQPCRVLNALRARASWVAPTSAELETWERSQVACFGQQ
jgi:hypothetical protein